jgi:hypothetical protein
MAVTSRLMPGTWISAMAERIFSAASIAPSRS